tara:strand:+ start:39 stop:1220 length:1182 start_codon:yes stop_codon:yes gene_type:complete
MNAARANLGTQPMLTLGIAVLLYAFSIILIDIAPFFIGMYVDHLGLSLSEAGVVQTVDQAGGVLGAVAGFVLMPKLAWRTLLVVASVIATIANVLTGFVDSFVMLMIIRFLSGFGVLLITTVTACILARALVPDRAFGIGLAVAMALSAVAVIMLDWLRIEYGYAASLGSGAIWLGAGIFLCFLLPGALGHVDGAPQEEGAAPENAAMRTMGITALIALGLFGLSVNVVYAYIERVGIANGLDSSSVAAALALGYVFATAGGLIPTIFGAAGGRLKWIILTTLVFFASLYVLYTANTVALYTLAYAIYASVWNMGLAYYMSLTVENDPAGHYTRSMYIVNVAAQSIGPAIAAMILTGAPLGMIFIVAPLPALLAAGMVIVMAARARKRLVHAG